MTRPALVVHVIATLTTGGAERQLEAVTAHSAYPSVVIALYSGGPVADDLRARGQRVEVLGMAGWRKTLAVPRLALRLRRLRPSVVHVHLLAAQLWGIPAARLAGVPVVVSTEHSLMETTIENRPKTLPLRLLYLALERLSSHTVAVSSTTARRLADWGVRPARVTVVDNGIDFAALRFCPAARARVRAELGLDPAAVVVGAVARLEPVKRVEPLVRALAPGLGPDRVLVVAGDGPQRPQLAALADELGVGGAVRLLGARRDVPALLSAMDLFVSPSRDETFGMAVVEALGSGLPVVYASCPALDELAGPPAWATQLLPADDGPAAEVAELARVVGTALAGGTGRRGVPAELTTRYGIATAAAALDALYVRLGAGTST